MVKYLQQLLSDIERSIELADQLPAPEWFPDYEENEENNLNILNTRKLGDIYDLPFEAFPPENLLSDKQIMLLTDSIHRLWSKWRIRWELPNLLTDKQHYKALLYAMQNLEVAWSPTSGSDLLICQLEQGGFCPFGEEGGYCHCRLLDDSVQHDIAIWEEHVRSQGLDPYRELSEEEGSAFEETMRNKHLQKRFGDDWLIFGLQDIQNEVEARPAEAPETFHNELEDDWVHYFLWEVDELDAESKPRLPDEENPDQPFTENGLEPPFF